MKGQKTQTHIRVGVLKTEKYEVVQDSQLWNYSILNFLGNIKEFLSFELLESSGSMLWAQGSQL